jgi:zinc and cadmium transporter
MSVLIWIIFSTIAMSALSLVGFVTLLFKDKVLKKIIFPLVAFSAGALLGGALLHMIPEAIEEAGLSSAIFLWVLFGFALFFLLEQFIHWHHCHKTPCEHDKPVTTLILIADSLHNFLGGIAIGSAFVVDIHLGIITWLIAAAHEIPQELGDFGILIHGGWSKFKALGFNFLSSLTMIAGGILAYLASAQINVLYLLPFAAGNFIYIAASDLIPEIKHSEHLSRNALHFITFIAGIALMYAIKLFG